MIKEELPIYYKPTLVDNVDPIVCAAHYSYHSGFDNDTTLTFQYFGGRDVVPHMIILKLMPPSIPLDHMV